MSDECHGALDLSAESLDFTHGFSWTLQVQNPTFSAEDSKVSVYYTNESPKMASFNRTFGTAERKAFLSALFEDSVSGVKRSWNTEYAPYMARTEDMPRKPLDAVVRGREFR